jgi:pimeloyl-ACP methyl ester carboxylesterase
MAMRNRPDQTKTLKRFKKPTLFLAGEKDPGIPVDSIYRQAAECQKPEIHVLSNVAHMAMFEQPEEAAYKINSFLSKI